jgi:hypothetical protein
MKRSDYMIILITLLLFAGISWWVMQIRPKPAGHVALTALTNATDRVTFRLQNDADKELFLSWMFVEVKTPGGWLTVSNIVPQADQVVGGWKTKDIPIQAPAGTKQWRLRLAYGKALTGPGLFLAKVGFTIFNPSHRFPGAAFGVFTGSNSLSSAEVVR